MKTKKRITKTEKLLKAIRKAGKQGFTHKQIVKFLLRGTGRKYGPDTRRLYDSYIYGTRARTGITNLLVANEDFLTGKPTTYTVRKGVKTKGPFTQPTGYIALPSYNGFGF